MSIEIQLLNEGKGLLCIYRGMVRNEDDQQAVRIIDDRHDRSAARFAIIDDRNVTEHLETSEEIRETAQSCITLSQRVPRFIVAFIAPGDLSFGLGRMWQALADKTSWSIRVFRDMSAGEEWLCQEHRDVFSESLEQLVPGDILAPEVERAPA